MKLFHKITLTLTVLLFGGLSFVPATASAGPFSGSKGQACKGATLSDGSGCGQGSGTTLSDRIEAIVNVLSTIIGIAAVVMIIIGGFRYVTSGGDSAGISSAKNTIIYAIVGLIVVALAQFIVRLVINRST